MKFDNFLDETYLKSICLLTKEKCFQLDSKSYRFYNEPMIIFLIPTAKEMGFDGPTYPHQLPEKSSEIIEELSHLSKKNLEKLYKITPVAAQVEYERIQDIKKRLAPAYPALDLFNGLMYRNIKNDLNASDRKYLFEHTYITSSLYGIISPNQQIAPHRLDFNLKLKLNEKSLKVYWRNDFDSFANSQDTIISLLSSEFEMVFSPELREKFVTITFMEEKNGQLKKHSTISKKARGKLLAQAAKKNSQSLDDLKKLIFDGFTYQESLSENPTNLTFLKKLD
jgi:cytoplasmic iron level regulating protein YaaA (DUF328/UPF0246 family)